MLERVAERLGAPIAKAGLGKDAVPDDSPYCTGGIGFIGTRASHWAMENCDGFLIVGSSTPFYDFWPAPGQARAVQIDVAGDRIGDPAGPQHAAAVRRSRGSAAERSSSLNGVGRSVAGSRLTLTR